MVTPSEMHHGQAAERIGSRTRVLQAAYERNPKRFPKGIPVPKLPPTEVWINQPKNPTETDPKTEQPAH